MRHAIAGLAVAVVAAVLVTVVYYAAVGLYYLAWTITRL